MVKEASKEEKASGDTLSSDNSDIVSEEAPASYQLATLLTAYLISVSTGLSRARAGSLVNNFGDRNSDSSAAALLEFALSSFRRTASVSLVCDMVLATFATPPCEINLSHLKDILETLVRCGVVIPTIFKGFREVRREFVRQHRRDVWAVVRDTIVKPT